MFKKLIWLAAGLMVGVGLSSTFANTRTPASYQFKVVAVSTEDAAERAAEMMKDGELKADLSTDGLVSATVPYCKEIGNDYSCETHLTYRK
jgi:beta-lactam-binding protein with PASTA domain